MVTSLPREDYTQAPQQVKRNLTWAGWPIQWGGAIHSLETMMTIGLAAALLGAFLVGGAVGAFAMLLCTFWEQL